MCDQCHRLRRQLALANRSRFALMTTLEIESQFDLPHRGVSYLKNKPGFPQPHILGPGWPELYEADEVETWLGDHYQPRRRTGRPKRKKE